MRKKNKMKFKKNTMQMVELIMRIRTALEGRTVRDGGGQRANCVDKGRINLY